MPSAFTQGILATPLPVALGGTGLSSLGTSLQVVRVNAGATALEYATIGALTDGDKGDITVSSSGTVWVIDNSAVTLAKIANIATASILGRNTAGTGVIEELSASTTKTLLSLDNVDNVSLLSWNGSTNIDTLGLITTGTWQADPIGVAYGGTGITSISALSVWVANSANTITEVTPTAGQSIRINAGATAWEAYTPGSGGGDVTKVGTPVNNQIGVWTGDGTIEGTTGLTYDGSNFLLTGDIGATGTRVTKGWFTDLQVTNAIAGSVTGNAATVTTNANLTGVVTSTGNATAIADNALSIAKTSGLQTALDGKQATITFGTGVQTALGVNIGSAGAPVLFNGVLGTPSSGTLTNATGLPIVAGTTGTLTVARGGTNRTGITALSILVADTTDTFTQITPGAGNSIRVNAGGTAWEAFTPGAGGSGTVTSVGWTGGIVSIATATTTPAFTIAGTSGGIPYFSSASTWATSAALASNALVIGGGAGTAPSTTTTGTGVLTALGVNVGSAGAFVTFNGALGTPSSGTVTNLTGTASININGTVGATTPSTGSFTTVTTSGNIELGNASDTTLSRSAAGTLAVEGIRVRTTTPLIVSAASYTTDTGTSLNMDNLDHFVITAQAGALLFNAPGGTLVQGRSLVIRIKDNGTARALTWNAVFRAMGTALPSTTVLSKTLYLGFFYNSTDTKWDLVASAQEA